MAGFPRLLLVGNASTAPATWAPALRVAGFELLRAGSLAEGLASAADSGGADLVLHGAANAGGPSLVAQDLRRLTGTSPWVLCVAACTAAQRAQAFDEGADEVLDESMPTLERHARLRRLVRCARRGNSRPLPVIQSVGLWQFDRLHRSLRHADGRSRTLTEAESRLLEALLSRPGEVLSRERLLELTGDEPADLFDRSIDSRICRLRRKLDDGGAAKCLLSTVWGRGYRLLAAPRPPQSPEPEPVS